MYSLDYPVMKTDRAKIHLDAFNRELNDFLNKPDAVVRKNYEQDSRYICRTEFTGIPKTIGMVLGEFLYCMRSGLDQLAWQLALPAAKTGPSFKRICFPIFESITDRQDRQNWERVIGFFPDAVAAVITALQPYNGPGSPKDHALWQLNELCNIDKHRIIPVHSQEAPIFVPANTAALIQYFDDSDAIEVSVPIADAAQLNFDLDSPMSVVFGEWSSDFAIPRERLSEIYNFVRNDVIPRFASFISKTPEPPAMRIAGIKTIYNG